MRLARQLFTKIKRTAKPVAVQLYQGSFRKLESISPPGLAIFCVPRRKTGYNLPMLLAVFALRLLEVMFFVGLAGSTVVVLISFIEDAKELFGKD